jgi:uncharacterized membrane protein YcaP (DUF421 family)
MQIDLLGLDEKDLQWYQMFIRTIIVFISAIVFIRIAGMRTFGTKTAFDVVVSITLGALLSRCISGHYPFFATLSSALFLALFHRICSWAIYKSNFLSKIMEGQSILLYKNGEKKKHLMAKNCISDKDITKALHEDCLSDLEKVKEIWLEPDGKLSVVKKN